MSAGVSKREKIIAAAAVAIVGLLLGGYFAVNMRPGKGLRISPPVINPADAQKTAENRPHSIDHVGSASVMAFFGLDINPPVAVASAAPEIKKSETPPVATPTAIVPVTPPPVDLAKKGYKLRGIVLEDGRSAAFVFVPAEKKVLVLRENASGTVRLLETDMRRIRLQTPEGTGYLELDSAKASPGGSAVGAGTSAIPAAPAGGGSGTVTGNTPVGATGAGMPRQGGQAGQAPPNPMQNADAVAGLINQGKLRISQERGRFSVEIKEIPELLKDYDLKPGDRIIGTDAGEFRRSQDVALNLGSASEKSHGLRIQRNGRIINLSAPMRQPPAGIASGSPGLAPPPGHP